MYVKRIVIKFFWTIVEIVGYVIMVRGPRLDSYGLSLTVKFNIFNLNMNEWVPVKGRIEVVSGKLYRTS